MPLRNGGFAVGLVARSTKRGKILLAYFFGPRREFVPRIDEVASLGVEHALAVWRVGDLGLIQGDWPIIGKLDSWQRSDWPMPHFIRRELLPPYRNWRVYFSDADPAKRIKEEPETSARPELPDDGLWGAGAAEIKLTELLDLP